jgi:hypothetical protein
MNRMGIRSSPGATSSRRQVNAPGDREVQLGDITNFAVTTYLAELTDREPKLGPAKASVVTNADGQLPLDRPGLSRDSRCSPLRGRTNRG